MNSNGTSAVLWLGEDEDEGDMINMMMTETSWDFPDFHFKTLELEELV